jgi:hypothetical protein
MLEEHKNWGTIAHLRLSLNGSASSLERGYFCAARRAQNAPNSGRTMSPSANSSRSSTAAATALGQRNVSVTSRSRRQPDMGEPSLDRSRHTFRRCEWRCGLSMHAACKTCTAHGHKAPRGAQMRCAMSAQVPAVHKSAIEYTHLTFGGKFCAPLLDRMFSMST